MRNAVKYSLLIYVLGSLSVFIYIFHCNKACNEALIKDNNNQTFFSQRIIIHDKGYERIKQSSIIDTNALGFYTINSSITNGLSGERYNSRYSLNIWSDKLFSIQLQDNKLDRKKENDHSSSHAYLEEYFHEEYFQVVYNKGKIMCSTSLSTNFLNCSKTIY
ncbi:hypothetical protein [Photobacterium sanguinicancri]|uniref:hypothetical protein n=1 Tax=Photobacterium sanguinicancri TaxID=875932 RepID=UPI0021C372C4|nr:hypothetical protein [Photobacterium sanguinicancri]